MNVQIHWQQTDLEDGEEWKQKFLYHAERLLLKERLCASYFVPSKFYSDR